jgi:hypothetical protein
MIFPRTDASFQWDDANVAVIQMILDIPEEVAPEIVQEHV